MARIAGTIEELGRQNYGEWEIVISDAGSSDGTFERVTDFLPQSGWKLIRSEIKDPSIGKTINQGIKAVSGDYMWILPVDTHVSVTAFKALCAKAIGESFKYSAFAKSYEPTSAVLKIYEFFQNSVRLKLLRHVVWTNGICISKSLIDKNPIPSLGFLEDVLLSDQLKKKYELKIIEGTIEVSPRRYFRNGTLSQIFTNLFIMTFFRMRIMKLQNLKTIYNR